ncbi:hypothetical protein BDW59DRAFT_139886 [Aspergillus cavernicola]|uniref:Uncharacterized protein n=1 Tax=Aspergillus cavernicola TaxID=176166 RepID=A0ABR4IWQ1_9EURO
MTISAEAIVGIVAALLASIPVGFSLFKYWKRRVRNARVNNSLQDSILPVWSAKHCALFPQGYSNATGGYNTSSNAPLWNGYHPYKQEHEYNHFENNYCDESKYIQLKLDLPAT